MGYRQLKDGGRRRATVSLWNDFYSSYKFAHYCSTTEINHFARKQYLHKICDSLYVTAYMSQVNVIVYMCQSVCDSLYVTVDV